MISRAETWPGVELNYLHQIEKSGLGLLMRCKRIFGVLDPNKHVFPPVFHAARLRGAIAAYCGTCVEAEINLAKHAGVAPDVIQQFPSEKYEALPYGIAAVARLADNGFHQRQDDPSAQETVVKCFGDAGLVELCLAMDGAAFLPSIKRAMGYATQCDIALLKKISSD